MLSLLCFAAIQIPLALPRAHSHNDYHRVRPLAEALENGFGSVEVDVFLVDGALRVGHDRPELTPAKTLASLYLDPLQKRVREKRGRIYPGEPTPLWVLVDIKEDGLKVYRAFVDELARYPDLQWKEGRGSVRFVISGDRPVAAILEDKGRHAALDGRWSDLDRPIPADVMPWVSESWTNHFKWIGAGAFPADMSDRLKQMVGRAHEQGRRIRFWGAPDLKAVWEVQWDAGVDLLNSDRPKELREWMLSKERLVDLLGSPG